MRINDDLIFNKIYVAYWTIITCGVCIVSGDADDFSYLSGQKKSTFTIASLQY